MNTQPEPVGGQRFGLVRAALLSVHESARMVAEEDFDDPLAGMAISLASGPHVLADVTKKQRARDSVLRYLARMGGRATPYGLFAGTAPVSVGERRDLTVADPASHRVRVRIDLAALDSAVTEAVEAADLPRWPLRRMPSVRTDGETVRYAKAGDASADVISMRRTPVIEEVLRLLDNRSLLGAELIDGLQRWNAALTAEQLTGFLDQLVRNGLLSKAIDLVEPGVEPVDHAVSILDRIGDTERAGALRVLAAEATGVHPLDETLTERLHTAWDAAAEVIPAFAEIKRAQRFDVQLELCAPDASLDERTVRELEQAIARVATIAGQGGGPVSTSDDAPGPFDMAQFRGAFLARYEDAEVPLLSAVDLESGVLKSWHRTVSNLAATAGVRADGEPAVQPMNPALLRIFDRWQQNGGPVDIADVEPAEQTGARAALAVTLDGYQGRFSSMLVGGVGRAPLALLARFGLGREELQDKMTGWLAEQPETGEEDPIHAELVYHPGGRIGNVLVRPKILDDSIALTGAAGGTLSLDRLTIQLRGEQFRLRDTVTGRPVLVELNTAHNVDFIGLDPVYAVLGHLASSGGVGWSWGALSGMSHLPRVTSGSVIVAPEQWRLSKSDIEAVLAEQDATAALRRALAGFDGRRWVGVGGYDNVLPIDTESDRSVRAVLNKEAEKDRLQFVEMPQLEAPGMAGPTGRHVAEVVLPLGPARRTPPQPGTGADRVEQAGGKSWLYAKFYCGQAAADVVVQRARQLAAGLTEAGAISDWFFLRYSDDGYHVRLRLRPVDEQHRPRVAAELDRLGAALTAESLTSRAVLDDYVPEIARYGGAENLRLAEELFTVSSEQVAAFLAQGPSEDVRLYQAVADIMAWTVELFDDPEQRMEFLRLCQSGLGVSFTKTGNPHGKFARAHDEALSEHLANSEPDELLRKALAELATSARAGLPERRAASVLGSALHLHCNRMFAFDAVRLEYLSYELALRKTRQQAARRQKGT